MSYDSAEVIASKVKNKQQQVEITIALNTASTNYDESKGTNNIFSALIRHGAPYNFYGGK